MKTRFSVRVLAVLMAALMLLPILSLQAAALDKKDCPEIAIHGFMASDVLVDSADGNSEEVWPPSTDAILDAVKQALPSIARLSVTWDWDRFSDDLIRIVKPLFEKSELDYQGNPVIETSGVYFNPEPSLYDIKNGNTLRFKYDWRVDPLISADQLNDYIDRVLELSGAEKVTLTAHSLGGVVMMCYFVKYGHDKVKSVCFNTTAIYGETYTGELLSGKIRIHTEDLQYYLGFITDETEYDYLIFSIVDMLQKAGLLDFVSRFGNLMIEKISEKVLPAVLIPLFAHWLTIWAMIPDEYVDDCLAYVFDDVMKDSGVDYTVLREKIDAYNTQVRAHRDETLDEMNNNKSISLYVISRYGYASLPLTPSYENMSDGVIDTARSSFGATTAKFGDKLTAEQIAAGGRYVNPEQTIDASTCRFPDQTWLIRNYPHANNYDSLEKMIDTLLYSSGQATIDTYKEYPQYLEMHMDTRTMTPDTGVDAKDMSFFAKVKLFFEQLFRLLKTLFAGLSK